MTEVRTFPNLWSREALVTRSSQLLWLKVLKHDQTWMDPDGRAHLMGRVIEPPRHWPLMGSAATRKIYLWYGR